MNHPKVEAEVVVVHNPLKQQAATYLRGIGPVEDASLSRMASLTLLLQLLLMVSAASAWWDNYYGGQVMFTPKGRKPDGTFEVEFRDRQASPSCYRNDYTCYYGDCGYQTDGSSSYISGNYYSNYWCQNEMKTVRKLRSNLPFAIRYPTYYNYYNGNGYWMDNSRMYNAPMHMMAHVDMGIRSDTGQSNSPPVTSSVPIFRIPRNCPRSFNLTVFDPDGDQVRCRVPTDSSTNECGLCGLPNGFSLDPNSCSLKYTPINYNYGYYPIELVVEDFPKSYISMYYSDGSYATKQPLPQGRHTHQTASTTGETSTTDYTTSTDYTTYAEVPTTTYPYSTTTEATTTTYPDTTTTEATTTTLRRQKRQIATTTTTTEAPTTTTVEYLDTTTTTTETPTTTYPYSTTTEATPTTYPDTTTTEATPTTYPDTTTTEATTTTYPDTTTTEYPYTTTTTEAPTTTYYPYTDTTYYPYTDTTYYPYSSTINRPSVLPLSKLPLQFIVYVDNDVPSCTNGDYIPIFMSPTPSNGANIPAYVNRQLEIKVRSSAKFSRTNDLILTGPSGVSKRRISTDEFVITWTPTDQELNDHFPICFFSEAYYPYYYYYWYYYYQYIHSELRCVTVHVAHHEAKVTCDENSMKVEVEKDYLIRRFENKLHLNEITDYSCNLYRLSNSSHLVAEMSLGACGTYVEEDDYNIYFRNAITSADTNEIISRNNDVEIAFECGFPKRNNLTLGYIHKNPYVFTDKGFGTFTFQFEFYDSQLFLREIAASRYPVEVDLQQMMFIQIEANTSIPNVELFVESVKASPYDTPNSRVSYTIIENGCVRDKTVQLYPGSQSQFRFGMEAFEFIGAYPQVYIHSTVILCEAGAPNTRCSQKCLPSSHRYRREAAAESSRHSISQGPLRLGEAANSQVSSLTANLGMNLIFIVGCLLVCGVVIYKVKRSRAKYQLLSTSESD